MASLTSMLFSNGRWTPPTKPLSPRDYSPSVHSTNTKPTVTTTRRFDDPVNINQAASPSSPSLKSAMMSVSPALILLSRGWQHSAMSPTIAQGDGESDSDATCVATEKESSNVKAGIASNAKGRSNFLVPGPQRKHPRAAKRLLDISAYDTAPASKIVDVVKPPGESQSFDFGAVIHEDDSEDEGRNWQEEAIKLNAQLSEAMAESGRLILGLQKQLEVAEESLRREQHEAWTRLRAEVGMKDLYIRSLRETKREGQVVLSAMQERIARAEDTIAQLGDRLAEKEVEGIRKNLHIRSLTRRIEQSESRFVSMEAALEQKDVELALIQDVLAQQDTMERISNKGQETVSLLKDMVAKKDADIDQLSARLAREESQSRQKDRQICSLSETSKQLEGRCSSLKQTITKNDFTIKDLKDRLAECLECLRLALEAGSGPGKFPDLMAHYWASYPREVDSGTKPPYTIYGTA